MQTILLLNEKLDVKHCKELVLYVESEYRSLVCKQPGVRCALMSQSSVCCNLYVIQPGVRCALSLAITEFD